MLHNIDIILRWISRYWFPSIPDSTKSELITYWIELIYKWVINNGPVITIKRIKLLRLIVTRYLCGSPLMVNNEMIGVTPEGFPKLLLPFKELVDNRTPEGLRFTLTCLGVSRSFPTPGPIDYSSIEKPFSGTRKLIDDNFVEKFVEDFTGNFNPLVNRPSPLQAFLSLKSGPLGGPAILAAQVACARFTGINLWGLAGIGGDTFMEWIKLLKSSIKINMDGLYKLSYEDIKTRKVQWRNRRFIHISDPEMKHRIVGCYDYISQLAFDPLSKWLFNCLRLIPQDRTFTQDPFISKENMNDHYHSLDLSAATDRFPIELQVQLLSKIAGPFFATCWKNLMVAEPFVAYEFLNKGLEFRNIGYQVGQPMGARSSWAMFTVAHHMIVQYAGFLNNQYPFKEYILLGDDIVITNDKVAKSYRSLLAELGVEISSSKTHVSKDTYEFAKRWFHKGIEVSPVPIAGFVSNIGNPKLLYSQILDLIYKGRGPRSIVSSIQLATSLISSLRVDVVMQSKMGFYAHSIKEKGRISLLYSSTEIKYFNRAFQELNLVFRNLKEFDPALTRAFMAKATARNEYTIPSQEVILNQEWSRAASGVVNGMAMSVVKDLNSFYKRFKDVYQTAIQNIATVQNNLDIGNHPLTYAIYNSVRAFSDMNKAMGYTNDLSKQLETVTLLDLTKLETKERTSINMVFTYSTLGRKLFLQMQDDPDLIISKARTMQFGRGLLDIQFAMQKEYPHLKMNK